MKCVSAVLFVVSLLCPGSFVSAQTQFLWPDVPVDLDRYTTVEECVAAVNRVTDSVRRRSPIWADTTPFTSDEARQPLPTAAVRIAEQCSRKFDPKTVSLRDWTVTAELYLAAQRDSAVEQLLRRQVVSVDSMLGRSSDSLHLMIFDTLVGVYLAATPARIAAARQLVNVAVARKELSIWSRFGELVRLMNMAIRLDDTSNARWAATQIRALDSQFSESEKRTRKYQTEYLQRHHTALEYLIYPTLLDSLRRGTPAWVALKRANWAAIKGTTAGRASEPMNPAIGKLAPPLEGEHWFVRRAPRGEATGDVSAAVAPISLTKTSAFSRPARGQISLVVFFTQGCRELNGANAPIPWRMAKAKCWDSYAMLRRIARRFPALEITIVYRTSGYFWPLPPMDPESESTIVSQWLLDFHDIPATLVVANTPYWLLESPDLRRINEASSNDVNYAFGFGTVVLPKTAILVDREGIVVDTGILSRMNEARWNALIEVLMTR